MYKVCAVTLGTEILHNHKQFYNTVVRPAARCTARSETLAGMEYIAYKHFTDSFRINIFAT